MVRLFGNSPIEPFEFNLPAENPIFASSYMYDEMKPVSFDMHYELEVGIVYTGRVIRKYQSDEIELSAGQVWLGGVWEPQGFQLVEVPCEVFVFVVSPEFLVNTDQPGFNWFDIFSAQVDKRPQIPDRYREEVLRICDKLRPVLSDAKPGDLLWKKLLLMETLLYLIEDKNALFLERKAEAKNYLGIQPGIRLVFQSKKLVPVESAAKVCSMSPSYFSKIFKEFMGISFSKFALRYRIKEAARQLAATEDSIKAIAVEWGFNDPSHFQNCFKSHFSISPGEYRALHKKRF